MPKISTNNYHGQALPYFFMMMVVLLLCWMMIINLGRLMYEKMMVQNAADNAALSIAAYRARVLNKLGAMNYYFIGCPLYGGEDGLGNYFNLFGSLAVIAGPYGFCLQMPLPPMRVGDNKQKVVSYLDTIDHFCPGTELVNQGGEHRQAISLIRTLVDAYAGENRLQDAVRKPYPGTATLLGRLVTKVQSKNSSGENIGPEFVPLTTFSLGLKRNRSGITYYYVTGRLCISAPPIPIVLPSGFHTHFWFLEELDHKENAWLYADKKTFYKSHKITVQAVKLSSHDSNRGYPFGDRLFGGIEWPDIMAIASAATYNDGGPMFPIEDVEEKDASNKISPVIDEYKKAENKGWRAHLVPVGSGLLH